MEWCDTSSMASVDEQLLPRSERIKELLEHGSLVEQSVIKECENTNVIFSWRICDYSKLRYNVLYFRLFENTDFKCVFKMFKTKRALHVGLRISKQIIQKTARFSIQDETDNCSLLSKSKELINGLYAGEFINDLFLISDFVKNGMLTVLFRYVDINTFVVEQVSSHEPDIIADRNEFCNDMKYMYLASLHSDFIIRVSNYTFDVHKFVLASRSKFFENFFKSRTEREYSLEAPPRIVHTLLLYVYSGEFKNLEMASMLELYAVAQEMGIRSLSNRCLSFIDENINDKNYRVILDLARKLDSADLKLSANRFNKKRKKERRLGYLSGIL